MTGLLSPLVLLVCFLLMPCLQVFSINEVVVYLFPLIQSSAIPKVLPSISFDQPIVLVQGTKVP